MRFLLFLFILFSFFQIQAQDLINLNPNPNGEPWYVGKLRKLTKEDYKKIEQTPKLELPANYQKIDLPTTIDNSLNKYFRPIFLQQDGSCGQASGVGYHFTYAIDFARDVAANTSQTQYPTHFTYNFLNGGADNGSFYFDGWEIINDNGCPNVDAYGGMFSSLTTWTNGYSSYYEAMKNRILEVFTIDVSTTQGLETLKAWMNDQLNGSSAGGLANFSGGVSGSFKMGYLPNGTPEQGAHVITFWDSEVNHAMTFVGYNDNIRYDFNGDGQYTNNKDIDGNGILDLRDFEVGGLIMANSWGETWGDSGKAYVPYKLLAEPKTNGGIGSSIVHVIRAKATYTPKATMKATITHTSRGKLRVTAGVSINPNANKPDYTLQAPIFNFQGGDLYMLGGATESDKTIELGLDITPLLGYINSSQEARFFLVVEEKDSDNQSNGSIGSFSVIDYTNGTVETACPQTNIGINDNDTTYLWVNKALTFDKVAISTQTLPDAAAGFPYDFNLTAQNGTAPYQWDFLINYNENPKSAAYESIVDQALAPSDPDDGSADIDLPFSFPFYDKSYSKIKVSTDGSILFGNQFEYVRDLAGIMATTAITVYGSDLMVYPSDGDGIWYKSTSDSLTVRWKISKFDNQAFNADFSVTLFPSGIIKYNYGSGITSSTDWISGVSMGNGVSYNIASIAGLSTIPADLCLEFTTQGFPEGLKISSDGKMTFTPKEIGKTWAITAKVTDLNRVAATKTLNLHSTEILKFSVDTLKFDSPNTPDPWIVGKDITITNSYAQAVIVNSIDWEGFGWLVSTDPIASPFTIDAGATLSLNLKLKSNFTKSSTIVFDSLTVNTDNVTYSLPILINTSIYSTPIYAITFNITNSLGALAGATINIANIADTFITNSSGIASVGLPDGTYAYTISYSNHISSSGAIVVNGSSQTINHYLQAMDVTRNIDESLVVCPNPFSNELIILGADNATFSIYNLIGNTVIKINNPVSKQLIDTENFPKGIYFLKVEDKNGVKTIRKLIKN